MDGWIVGFYDIRLLKFRRSLCSVPNETNTRVYCTRLVVGRGSRSNKISDYYCLE